MIQVALLWYLVLQLFSLAAFPLAYRAFSRLPERGWALSKPLGLLTVGFAAWLVGLTGIPVSPWSVLLALALVAAVSAAAARFHWRDALQFLNRNAATVATVELLFLAVFLGMVLFRAGTPDIVHTEQPMDFMFLNSVVVSPHYPPQDAWLAGGSISYYYFGYLLIGTVSLLSGIATPIAYNLGLATAAALGAVAAFGLTYNLVRLARGSIDGAVAGGLTAAFVLVLAGNLIGMLDLARAAGAGTEAFWTAMGGSFLERASPSPSWAPDHFWWWFDTTRVIPGAIAEFPAFSFVLGDLHPHVMSVGFLLLAAGVATQTYLQNGLLRPEALYREWPLMVTGLAAVGGLVAINTWDFPVGLALVGGALLLNAARNERTARMGDAVALQGGTLVAGIPGDDGTGAVLVCAKDNGRWTRKRLLTADSSVRPAHFGQSVALDRELLAVGAPGDGERGAVHVFERTEGTWERCAVARPPERERNMRSLGRSVAVEGQTVAAGGLGSAFVFRVEPGGWRAEAVLGGSPEEREAGFGSAVGLAGSMLAVGAPQAEGGGAVHLFTRAEGDWEHHAVLAPPADRGVREFGKMLALTADRLAVGADSSVFVFRQQGGSWSHEAELAPPKEEGGEGFPGSVALYARRLIIGAPYDSGAAHVFSLVRGRWRFDSTQRGDDLGADAGFGASVGVEEDTIAVGVPGKGHGGVYVFGRGRDGWRLGAKIGGRWRFVRAVVAGLLLLTASLIVMAPFLFTFESGAGGVLPLRGIITRPLHLFLFWGAIAVVVLPLFGLLLWRAIRAGRWNGMRLGVALFIGFAPVILWLQPIWGIPFFAVALLFNGLVALVFGLYRAGYRLPKVDEMSFSINPGLTRVAGLAVLVGLLLWDGIRHGERGVDGRFVALDRLVLVVPMALVVSLAIYAAWTLAHRDSEALRRHGGQRGRPDTRHDGIVPVLLLFMVASALIMGVELFYVVDQWGGSDLRRQNTLFKLYYQGWILMAVAVGFGIWYISTRLDRSRLGGRLAHSGWTLLLVLTLGAVLYYPLAATASRFDDSNGLTLDGQAHLARSAPDEYAAIEWLRENTARDAVVLETPRAPCAANPEGCSDWTDAGRIASSTGRPTVIGWLNHEQQWRTDHVQLAQRMADVLRLYETPRLDGARNLLDRYNVDYVVVGTRERGMFGAEALAKFAQLGEPVFSAGDEFVIYDVRNGSNE